MIPKLSKRIQFVKNKFTVVLSRVGFIWLISASKLRVDVNNCQLTIVTGADSSHFRSLLNLLTSIEKYEPTSKVSVWNLGLTEIEKDTLKIKFPNFELKSFEFDKYPQHLNIKVNAGEYAWKPAIIYEEFNNQNEILLWLDAGDLLTSNLRWIKQFIKFSGFYSPYSSGTLIDWTHPTMLKRFNVGGLNLCKRNLNGAIIGFDTQNTSAKDLVIAWFECAMEKECIAPDGSGRSNHRQDQAALTCLAYNLHLAPHGFYAVNRKFLGILQHQDA